MKRHDTHEVTFSNAGHHRVPEDHKASSSAQSSSAADMAPEVRLWPVMLCSASVVNLTGSVLSAGEHNTRSKQQRV